MNRAYIDSKLLRLAKEAFDIACTLRPDQRIEVYLDNETPKRSDILEENEAIVYTDNKILCYQIFGHDFLEPEITEWIARSIQEEEPKELEKSIIETAKSIATAKASTIDAIHANEIFANLSMNQLEQIEHAILEYWWVGKKDDNAKLLAEEQIAGALAAL
jgi:hypothetical protein